jgi:hypothetical protein
MRYYDDWLTKDIPDDDEDCEVEEDRSDETFDRWDRERDLL